MIVDGRQIEPGLTLATDVCIIGAGAAGLTIAAELIGSGLNVIVLEAGGPRAERSVQDAARGVLAEGVVHDPLELVRQRRLGGTTTQWGGRCAMLDPHDFDVRPWVPESGWPISREELIPFYRRAHDYLRLGEFEYEASSALEAAEPLVDAERSPLIKDDALWRWSPPVDLWRAQREPIGRARHISVLHRSPLVRLHRDRHDGTVTHAEVGEAPERRFIVRSRFFVLAVGGLESARLLLASSEESPRGIGNDNDLVGRYYTLHPVAEIGEIVLGDPARASAGAFRMSRDGVYCRRMIRLTPEAQREHGLLNLAAALWYPDPTDPSHGDALLSTFALVRHAMARMRLDWKSAGVHRRYGEQLALAAHARNVVTDMPSVLAYLVTWVRRRWLAQRRYPSFMVHPRSGRLRLRFDAEQTPDRDNRVTLARERDELGVPRLRVAYRVSDADRDSIARSLRLISSEITASGAGLATMPHDATAFDSLVLADATHQLGLTRMGATARRGVVDARCRVHTAPNLYVASSAVFPTGGCVGPTLTVVALAIRIADDLRARRLL